MFKQIMICKEYHPMRRPILELELELGFNLVNHIKPRGNPNTNINMNQIPIQNTNTNRCI